MQKTFKHEASGTELLREIINPNAISLTDVFEDIKAYDDNNPPKSRIWETKNGIKIPVGPRCYFKGQGRKSLGVKCKYWVMEEIKKNMIPIENDSLYFEIISHDNGWSLIVISYNLILGSRWLAYVKTSSIEPII